MLCALLSPPLAADGAAPGWNELVYLIYRVEVTNYCGLTTDAVVAGFRRQRDALLAEHAFTQKLINNARIEADKLAHREWDNRGLGGFRRWCQTDATRYATEFTHAPPPP